jgi:PAS domain S-box-containing protein
VFASIRRRLAPPLWPWVARALMLSAAYGVLAWFSLRYATVGSAVAPVWPPAGLGVAALVLMGLEYWPAIFCGALVASATTNIPVLPALGIAGASVGEATLAAYLLRRRNDQPWLLDAAGSVPTLVGVAAPLGALAGAIGWVGTSWLTGMIVSSRFWSVLGLSWAGDYLGILVVAPVLLSWARAVEPPLGRRGTFELLALAVGTVVGAVGVFGNVLPATFLAPAQYRFLFFPLVIIAAVRFGPRGASLLLFILATLTVGFTLQGGGPLVMPSVSATDLALLWYLGILALTGLALSPTAARRARTEGALREASAYLHAVVQSSPLAIYTLDPASRVRTWNPAAETLYGWTAAEVVGQPLPTIGADRDDHLRLRERALGGETLSGMEITRRRKDGTPVTVSASVAPIHDGMGRVAGVLAIAHDLTGLRQLELQYRQAQKMEAVGRLAGGIAHDFNNLLTAILGITGLLLENLDPASPDRLDIAEIEKAAKRAAGLTRQLLVFSRQQVLEPRVLDLNNLVTNLERMLRRLIGEDVVLETRLDAERGLVRADPGHLEQAIVNLVVNARDAMPNGGHLTIGTTEADFETPPTEPTVPVRPGAYVVLTVTDTGVGMDAATQARLFEPFFTTKEPGRGTGLGLATVYGIVKQSDGFIWAQSALGQGTTFKLLLPRVTDSPAMPEAARRPGTTMGGTETILLVEDQEEVRTLITRILVDRGYVVLAATNGDQALELLQQHPHGIQLLLTDVVMPGLNGRELAQRVTAARDGLSVLYVSGYTGEAVLRHGLLEPGVAFLHKPFTPDVLARKVRQVLDQATRS